MTVYAKVIADSLHPQTDTRMVTFEVSFHRFILAEVNTHRNIAKNGQSSRAIPIETSIKNIIDDTAIPVSWGRNKKGMIAEEMLSPEQSEEASKIWIEARDAAILHARKLAELGVHKQLANRILEPFMYQKGVLTATSYDNLFWLRSHFAAQPEFKVLSDAMLQAYRDSTPTQLRIGDWHTPYFADGVWTPECGVPLKDALMISASCSAQVSYRKLDDSLEKAESVFNMLGLYDEAEDTRKHSSPVEHIGTPFDYRYPNRMIEDYVTEEGFGNQTVARSHIFEDGAWGSGNLRDFAQYRHLIPNESCTDYRL